MWHQEGNGKGRKKRSNRSCLLLAVGAEASQKGWLEVQESQEGKGGAAGMRRLPLWGVEDGN